MHPLCNNKIWDPDPIFISVIIEASDFKFDTQLPVRRVGCQNNF